ncbi:Mediator of RNA polymerase II transcription subunit 25 [Armadillidium vulgare]|nr:Mediator of RNA polymerase II transcription subunit 25 [Armadillidium vulgare]
MVKFFSGGISEENDVFFTQSSLVQYAVVFYGSELTVLGGSSQMETQGPTTSQLSILNAIKDANYSYKNTCRQAYILEALQTATEVFKCLSGGNIQKDNTKRCLVLVTQSVPINNPWATATPETILQELKMIGVKTSIISAHKMERTVSPSLISQPPTANINASVTMGMSTASTGPSPNPAQHNRPTPSPGLPHTGSPIPTHQQPNQLTRPVVMNQVPAAQPMQTQPQVPGGYLKILLFDFIFEGGIMIRPGQHMPPQANVAMNTMNTRPNRWAMSNTMMVSNQQASNQNPQMQQVPQQLQNPQMPHEENDARWGSSLRKIPCKISSQANNGKLEVKTDGWPATLHMLLVQKSLLSSVGNAYFQRTHKVMFYPDQCPALESLTASLSQGYAGCIHLSSSSTEVKMIILLYAADRKVFVGVIPLDQAAFVTKMNQVFQNQPRNMQQSQALTKQNV